MRTIKIKAPAKVNTLLRVIGRRGDGYHDLQMVMVPLSLADDIELEATDAGIEFVSEGETDPGMAGGKNLVWRAAALLLHEFGVKAGVRIALKKRIPVAAGLGGGSSDAAAVLKGLNSLWNLNWPVERLACLGASLGADVPFFCYERPAFVEGVGNRVSPCDSFPRLNLLLVNPGFAVATPWVYKQWDNLVAHSSIEELTPNRSNARVRPLFGSQKDVVLSLHNDLEAVTIPAYPEIARIKGTLMELGAAGALMSGSGPTVFGVFRDAPARDKALKSDFDPGWRVFAADSV